MGAAGHAKKHGHGHDVGERFYMHRHTVIHGMQAHVKLVATLAFVLVVVITPVRHYSAFALFALTLVALTFIARMPLKTVIIRSAIEIPFVLFAVLLPFFTPGPRVDVMGVIALSQPGLEQAFGILAKGTLGVVATIILGGTTQVSELLRGLERLRVPATIVQIATFMLRYANVVADEMRRMKVARESRGFVASGLGSWRILGQSAGALFIRSYERGERVHLAMLSRGFSGSFYRGDLVQVTVREWAVAASLPMVALLILLAHVITRGMA
jgi:cobalt/nickel transport system permease protein